MLTAEPDHPWATPSLYAARYLATGDNAWKAKLGAFVKSHPDNDRARTLAGQFEPYFGGYLPDPQEATVNGLRDLLAKGKAPARINISLSSMEAPSAILAVNRELQRHVPDAIVGVAVDEIQQPDPREPRAAVVFQLWRYDSVYAAPAVPEPPEEAARAVAALAMSPYSFDVWRSLAQKMAEPLAAHGPEEIAAVMAHPPAAPADMRFWTWLQRVQIAAALLIAHSGDGWDDTPRRRVLLDLANGPMDWTVGAAAMALTAVATDEPKARAETLDTFSGILSAVPTPGYAPHVLPVVYSYLAIPDIDSAERERLNGLLKQYQST